MSDISEYLAWKPETDGGSCKISGWTKHWHVGHVLANRDLEDY